MKLKLKSKVVLFLSLLFIAISFAFSFSLFSSNKSSVANAATDLTSEQTFACDSRIDIKSIINDDTRYIYFEYKLDGANYCYNIRLNEYDNAWSSNYYGKIRIYNGTGDGESVTGKGGDWASTLAGVTVEALSDGWYSIEFDLQTMTKKSGTVTKVGYIGNDNFSSNGAKIRNITTYNVKDTVYTLDKNGGIDIRSLTTENTTAISFDYKIDNNSTLWNIRLVDASCAEGHDGGDYLGFYRVANGTQASDYTGSKSDYFACDINGALVEDLGNGWYRIDLEISKLTSRKSGAGIKTKIGYIHADNNSDATGKVKNIQVYEGTSIKGVGTQYTDFSAPASFDIFSFEYKIANNDAKWNVLFGSGDNTWGQYKAFSTNYSGTDTTDTDVNLDTANGVTVTDTENGYKKVTFDLAALTRKSGTPSAITFIKINNFSTAGVKVYIKNLQFISNSVVRGETTTAGEGKNIDVTDGVYSLVEFDYKITNGSDKQLNVKLYGYNWDKYYGNIWLNSTSSVDNVQGVTVTQLSDGYSHVSFDLSLIDRTNASWNRNNVPDGVGFIYIEGNSTASGYIDNVKCYSGTKYVQGTAWQPEIADDNYDVVTFDYSVLSGTTFGIMVGDWNNYFGYYYFNDNGLCDSTGTATTISGIRVDALSNGYKRVTLTASSLSRANKTTDIIKWMYVEQQKAKATVFIDNFNGYFGEEFLATEDFTKNVTNGNYAVVKFDYLITSGTKFSIMMGTWDAAYGYFDFNSAGELTDYAGVTVESLSNGYKRVTVDISEVTKKDSGASNINLLYIWNKNTDANGFIDNITLLNEYTITVVNGTGSGTYLEGDSVTAVASVPAGYTFTSWTDGSGNFVSASQTYVFSASENITLTANFSQDVITYVVEVDGGSGSGVYAEGAIATVVANVPSGSYFNGWLDMNSETVVSYNTTYQFTVTEDVSLYADVYEYNGTAFAKGTQIQFDSEKRISTISFEYIFSNKDSVDNAKMFLKIYEKGWNRYIGGYDIDDNSSSIVGITLSKLDDGYSKVTLTIDNLNKVNNETDGSTAKPAYLYFMYLDNGTTATGYYRNLVITEKTISPLSDAVIITNGENNYLDIEEDCTSVSFDYYISNGADKKIAVMLFDGSDWDNYFGYYSFKNWEPQESYAGVTVTRLDNGFTRVTFNIASLTKKVGSVSHVLEIHIRGGWTDADGYIQNLTYEAKVQFRQVPGAAIRADGKANGLRFTFNINANAFDKDAKYGIIIIPFDYIAKYNLTGNYVTALTNKGVDFISLNCIPIADPNSDGGYYIQGTIANVKEANLNRDFVAFGYSLKDEVYTYAKNTGNIENARSFYQVASLFKEDTSAFNELSDALKSYFYDKLEIGSKDLLYTAELADGAFVPLSDNYSFSNTEATESASGSGYSAKFAVTSSVSGWPSAQFNLGETFDLSNGIISFDAKFTASNDNPKKFISIKLYDNKWEEVVKEIGHDFGSGWSHWEINCSSLELKPGKNLESVMLIRFCFDFETNTGNEQVVYLDNLKLVVADITANQETQHFIGYGVDTMIQVAQDESDAIETASNIVSMGASIGERENAQVIIKRKSSVSEKSFTVSFTDLTNGIDTISSSNITASMELYQNVASSWKYASSHNNSLYPSGKTTLPTGILPDALLPMDIAEQTDENKIGSNLIQGIFFTVNVPRGISSGLYKGFISVSIEGEGKINLPIELTVYNFALPEENASKMIVRINDSEMQALYTDLEGSLRETIEYKEAWDLLAERGISGGFACGTPWGSNTIDAYVEALKDIANDNRIATFFLSSNYHDNLSLTISYQVTSKSWWGKTTTKTVNENLTNIKILKTEDEVKTGYTIYGLKSILTRLVNESTNSCNLLKKAVVYFPQNDEPAATADYVSNVLSENALKYSIDYVLNHANFTGKAEVRTALQNLQYLVTSAPVSDLTDGLTNVSISNVSGTGAQYCYTASLNYATNMSGYCSLFSDFYTGSDDYTALIGMLNDDNYSIWWYGCCQPVAPYASYALNAPYTTARVNRWQQFGLGVEGEFYYMANRTQAYDNSTSTPLTEAQILAGGAVYEDGYGDGLLIYSVRNTYGAYGTYYLSSLRLENIAEGNDDYNYLVYAQSMIDDLGANKSIYQTRLDNILATLYTNSATNTTDPVVLRSARAALVELIEEINVTEFVMDDDEFVVANFTDIHVTDPSLLSENGTVAKTIEYGIANSNPDIMVFSGDIAGKPSDLDYICEYLDGFEIPYFFVMGNHDHDYLGYNAMAQKVNQSQYGHIEKGLDDIGSDGNYTIRIKNSDGELVHALVMMDTGNKHTVTDDSLVEYVTNPVDGVKYGSYNSKKTYCDAGWNGLRDEQIDWYEETVQSLDCETTLIVHIAFLEYVKAYEQYRSAVISGNQAAIDACGAIGECVMGEPCCGSIEQLGMFQAILDNGSTKNVICGHDHLNAFSLLYQGVRLTYAVKTGEGSYWKNDGTLCGYTELKIYSDGHTSLDQVYFNPLNN